MQIIAGSADQSQMKRWLLFLLPLPALIPLTHSIVAARSDGKIATGFIAYDMPYYLANGREHFDAGFGLTYRNPYASPDAPRIYFQPHILLLGLAQKSGLDPGLAFNLFGLAAMAAMTWVGIQFYRECIGLETIPQQIGLVCFFWGGGVLSLAGLGFGALTGHHGMDAAFVLDPSKGSWGLNFGRNLTYPTEAYYHALFFASMLLVIRENYKWALALCFLLSISHPFAGLTAAIILLSYAILERALKSSLPFYFLVWSLLILVFHLIYYLWFLNRFPDHRALQAQWELDWPYIAWTFVPALYITGVFTLIRFTRPGKAREIFSSRRNRVFVVWFLVVFGLTQHDLVLKPMQPLHFARGYDWAALFFLGAPVMLDILRRVLSIAAGWARAGLAAAFVLFFCSDNLLWLGSFFTPVQEDSVSYSLTPDQKGVLNWLQANSTPETMVVSQDRLIGYLVCTYTPANTWFGHSANTPHARERLHELEKFFENRRIIEDWLRNRTVFVAFSSFDQPDAGRALYRNGTFVLFQLRGTANSQSGGGESVTAR